MPLKKKPRILHPAAPIPNVRDGARRGPRILVVDVGGTHVKLLATGHQRRREFRSSPNLTAEEMVRRVKDATQDWKYDVVSLGYPGPVIHGRPLREPHNLGVGWVNFDFQKAFGRRVKLINDAAMQAVGSYRQGRMLFLGLGTGLGSAMIAEGIVEPMELAHLPYKKGKTYEDYVGIRGLKRMGRKKWERNVHKVVLQLSQALEPEEVVLGGGNVMKLKQVPPGVRLVTNKAAFRGGFRIWNDSRFRSRALR